MAALITLFYIILEDYSKNASKQSRRALADFLLATNRPRTTVILPSSFSDMFDKLFGPQPWTWKFFSRSVAASTALLVLMSALWFDLNQEFVSRTSARPWLIILVLAPILNFPLDYLSLVESRFIIRKMVGRSVPTIVFLMLVDLASTTLIVFLSFLIIAHIIPGDTISFYSTIAGTIEVVAQGYGFVTDDGFLGIFIYTTYSTSIWVWLYAMSVLTSRAIFRFSKRARKMVVKLFDIKRIKRRPHAVVAEIGAPIIFLCGILAVGIVSIIMMIVES